MTNAIIEAVSITLNRVFGDDYEIHMEEIRQDLKEPCFFISCLNPTNELFLGRRYRRTNQICIQYFPQTEEKQRECNDVAEKLFGCLEYVTLRGAQRPVRGTKMRYEVVDDILNFFVNYDGFVCREAQQTPMEELETDTGIKGGG